MSTRGLGFQPQLIESQVSSRRPGGPLSFHLKWLSGTRHLRPAFEEQKSKVMDMTGFLKNRRCCMDAGESVHSQAHLKSLSISD